MATNRAEIEREFESRATHSSQGQVDDTCSFARAERMLGREYFGRFLIELLQNASDAWREVSSPGTRSQVRIVLSSNGALLVANQGRPIDADIVIRSLGQIGASNKLKGSAIGHKGIGFKSVLEVTLSPEIYSRADSSSTFDLAVRFDPEETLASIRSVSPEWDAMIATVGDVVPSEDPTSRIPVLRYPLWVEAPPDDVLRIANADGDSFNTVIRVPYTERLGLSEATWIERMRTAFSALTDEILLLLGTFDRVTIEDETARSVLVIERDPDSAVSTRAGHITRAEMGVEDVSVLRNGDISSRWLLSRRDLNGQDGLASELAVGVKTSVNGSRLSVINAAPAEGPAPFHLFFPTHIATGFPFLLHGYFEVDAGRTGFYGGSASYNRRILAGLADLVVDTVHHLANESHIDVANLADVFAEAATTPVDPLAAEFQRDVLKRLDDTAWVSTDGLGADNMAPLNERQTAPPNMLLVDSRPRCNELLHRAFGPAYVHDRTGHLYPNPSLGPAGLEFLADRISNSLVDDDESAHGRLWAALGLLMRPGATSLWRDDDRGFVALVELLDYLKAEDPGIVRKLCDSVRGDQNARLLPTIGPVPGVRRRMPPPPPAETGQRGQLVLARVRERTDGEVAPPSLLGVALLADGLLDSAQLGTAGSLLGVREYTVDTVLDRLDGIVVLDDDAAELAQFAWRFLARERLSEFGLERAMRTASTFDPKAFFWCVPGRSRGADNESQRQVRARALSQIRLPSRSEDWRPASALVFGADWADWLVERAGSEPAHNDRVSAYRDLEELAPGDGHLLAPPAEIVKLLGPPGLAVTEDSELEEAGDSANLDSRALHAFLLRLGVAEVPPIEAAVDARARSSDQRIPWPGAERSAHLRHIDSLGGWVLGQTGYQHEQVHIAEDYRLMWSLTGDPERTARALGRGAQLYQSFATLSAFCTGCHGHTKRYWNDVTERYPSLLSHQIRSQSWVPCSTDGGPLVGTKPDDAWWDPQPPDVAGMRQSPLRFLPLAPSHLRHELRSLARISELRLAPQSRLRRLLLRLRDGYVDRALEPDPRHAAGARQAFIGLHRLVYERLATSPPEAIAELLSETGTLAELGDELRFLPAEQVRHDNGDFASYRRYFVGTVPFLALAKDRDTTAKAIGVPRFALEFTRREVKNEFDLTNLVAHFVGDRIPELLALLVFHSLGTQTLELGSQQFHERSRRLANLHVLQVDDLVLDASIVGLELQKAIGEGTDRDLFLEGATSLAPRLYHDIQGPDWEVRLRRRISPHLATLAGNPSYAATFQLLIQSDGEADREEFLLEHGIGDNELNQVRAALGYVSVAGRERSIRWFAAILQALGQTIDPGGVDLDIIVELLAEAGVPEDIARALAELGGDEEVRSASGDATGLHLLTSAGIDLRSLDELLRNCGDGGLVIRRADQQLRSWSRDNGRQVAWILHRAGLDAEVAKSRPNTWAVPEHLRYHLDPSLVDVIADAVSDLEQLGLDPDRQALSGTNATAELARLAGCDVADLEDAVRTLYSDEERAQVLRQRAAVWRRQLLLLAVVLHTTPHDSRSAIREAWEVADDQLPTAPLVPSALAEPAATMLAANSALASEFTSLLNDQLSGINADDALIQRLYLKHRGESAHLGRVNDVMARPAQERTRELRRRIESVTMADIAIRIPRPVTRGEAPLRATPNKKIRRIHVNPAHRKLKKFGDAGEQWALALAIRQLLALAPDQRAHAIEELTDLLTSFAEGEVVDAALVHAATACQFDLEDDELVEELGAFLHLSQYSDAFGFDALGWLAPTPEDPARALCLEVKSAKGAEFHVSTGEWARAEDLASDYAFLIVRRNSGDTPKGFDLIIDPVRWLHQGLRLTPDGYIACYEDQASRG